MKARKWMKTGSLIIIAMLISSACGTEENAQGNTNGNHGGNEIHDGTTGHMAGNDGVTKIPSADGGESPSDFPLTTTNKNGSPTNGMGTTVYSLIGSSSLHSEGLSSHLQSRLAGTGIHGIEVLVIDDAVILGQTSQELASNRYDQTQDQVINGTEGTSAVGPLTKSGPDGTSGSVEGLYNLPEALREIRSLLGDNVRILTVTDQDSISAINRVKENFHKETISPTQITNDISVILKNASPIDSDREKQGANP